MATKADIEKMIPGKTAHGAAEASKREAALDNPIWTTIWMGPHRGEYGAWVDDPTPPEPGDRIKMETKGGRISYMIVDEIVWSGPGKYTGGRPGHLVTLRQPGPAARRAPVAPAAPAMPTAAPVELPGATPESLVAVIPTEEEKKWSPLQEAIFLEAQVGQGHVVVLARAGSGKSTTAEQTIRRLPSNKTILFTAFNTKIVEAAKKRFAIRQAANVTVQGINSYGYAQVRKRFRKIRDVDEKKLWRLVRDVAPHWKGDARSALVKTVELMKARLEYEEWQVDALLDKYGIDAGEDEIDLTVPHERATFIKKAIELLQASKEDTNAIDFNDQIWFPVVYNMPCTTYDYVFIDETQDLNANQLELSIRTIRKGGRIFAVGDDRQAIYSFRGADEEAIPHIIERLNAKILKLTISYRCARRIAQEARVLVPDFESGSANEGVVETKSYEAMLNESMPGDFILSRTNAPLLTICWKLLRAGKRATIPGRDIGGGLVRLIEKAKDSGKQTIAEVQAWVAEYADREIRRLLSQEPPKENEAEAWADKVACIDAMAEGASSVDEVIGKIQTLFSDDKSAEDETRIVCSSTHKAKGLERDRVWLLRNTYMKRISTEESNLLYVGITRARDFLYYVNVPVG
jgi:DNA helicase II / ATP-dependent DNA helicase PcrA